MGKRRRALVIACLTRGEPRDHHKIERLMAKRVAPKSFPNNPLYGVADNGFSADPTRDNQP
jgi:hypothetical protein